MKNTILLFASMALMSCAMAAPDQHRSETKERGCKVFLVGVSSADLTPYHNYSLEVATLPLEIMIPEAPVSWHIVAVMGTVDTKRHNAYRFVNLKIC